MHSNTYSKLFQAIPSYSKLFQAIPSYSKLFQAIAFISSHRNKTLFLFENTQDLGEYPSLESFSSNEFKLKTLIQIK